MTAVGMALVCLGVFFLLTGAIGLILSVFVVFVVEYVSKARARQAAGRN